MIIRKEDGTLVQEEAISTWVFIVPENQKALHIIGAYSDDLLTKYNIDSHHITDGIITVSFGLDLHSGVLKYSYETDGTNEDTTIIRGEGGSINITIHQTNGGEPQSQP